MRTRSRVHGSALAVVERVFVLTTGAPAGLVVRRSDLAPDPGEGLPDGPIGLPELRRLVLSPGVGQSTRDAVWRVLIDRARADGASWLVAAVGMAMPGLRRQVRVLAGSGGAAREDLESAVAEGFVTALRTVDVTGRGLCGRLLRAGYRAGVRQVFQDAPFTGGAVTGFASRAPQPPWGHPDFVLADAVAAGVLSHHDAWLIGVTRLEDVPVAVVAAELGEPTNTVVARRRRAERCLRDALTTGLPGRTRGRADDEPADRSPTARRQGRPVQLAPTSELDGGGPVPAGVPAGAGSGQGVLAGVSRRGGWAGLTRLPSRVGDLAPVRGGSSVARGDDGPSGRGHGPDVRTRDRRQAPGLPRERSALLARRTDAAWSGGDLT